jgi:cation/acetate symporter
MNNPSTTPFSSSSEAKSSGLIFGRVGLVVMFIGLTSIYLLIANILEKIGLGLIELFAMVIFVPVTVYLVAAFTNRISGSWGQEDLGQFTQAGGTVDTWTNAMAGTAEWFSLLFIITIVAALSMTNHDAVAIITGVFCGFAVASILIIPKLTNQFPLTLSKIISSNLSNTGLIGRLLQLITAAIIILCSMIFLVTQVEAGSHIITLYFPINRNWAGILLLTPVIITLVSGGMRSLTMANMLLIWLIGAAILVPLIWLSIDITGNPIPQLSFGNGALQPILQLEEQLVQLNSEELGEEFEQGNFIQIAGFANFFASVICIMAATSMMPQLYSRISCSSGISTRIRTTGWMMLFIALLISALPAFVIFTKFEIYHDLIGLPLIRLENEIGWLLNWANTDNGQLALVCGRPAVDLQTIIVACGNDPEYVLIPSDLKISPLVSLLGASEITDMPAIISALSFAGLLSASTTTAAISMMVIVNSVNEFLFVIKGESTDKHFDYATTDPASSTPGIPVAKQSTTPIARHLFVSRLMLLAIAAGSIWLAGIIAIPITNLFLWALLLLASTIFPVMILVLWWKYATELGVLMGIICAISASIYLIISIEYGADWIFQNGDEQFWTIPFSKEPLKLLNSAIIIIPVTVCIVVFTSITDRAISNKLKARKQLLIKE